MNQLAQSDERNRLDWDLDTYGEGGIDEAIDVVRDVSGSADVNTLGFPVGGILMTTVLNHLAANGDDRVHSAGLCRHPAGFPPAGRRSAPSPSPRLLQPRPCATPAWGAGVITARQMGAVFTWMRPDDLVFNYLVSEWLLGDKPPAFDILAWNADGTNRPPRLHGQFLEIFGCQLARAGRVQVTGARHAGAT